MTATTERLYEIREAVAQSRRILSAYIVGGLPSFHIAAACGPRDSDDSDHWGVILGFDAAEAIGDSSHAYFEVRDEEQARQWLDLLARLYFASPSATDQ